MHVQHQEPEPDTAKWISAIIRFIISITTVLLLHVRTRPVVHKVNILIPIFQKIHFIWRHEILSSQDEKAH